MKALIQYVIVATFHLFLVSAANAAIPTGHFVGEIKFSDCDEDSTEPVEMLINQSPESEGSVTYYGIFTYRDKHECDGDRLRRSARTDKTSAFILHEMENGSVVLQNLRQGRSGNLEQSIEQSQVMTGLFSLYRGRPRLNLTQQDRKIQIEVTLKRVQRLFFTTPPATIGRRFENDNDDSAVINDQLLSGTVHVGELNMTAQFQLDPVFPGLYTIRSSEVTDAASMAVTVDESPDQIVVFTERRKIGRNRFTARILDIARGDASADYIRRRR